MSLATRIHLALFKNKQPHAEFCQSTSPGSNPRKAQCARRYLQSLYCQSYHRIFDICLPIHRLDSRTSLCLLVTAHTALIIQHNRHLSEAKKSFSKYFVHIRERNAIKKRSETTSTVKKKQRIIIIIVITYKIFYQIRLRYGRRVPLHARHHFYVFPFFCLLSSVHHLTSTREENQAAPAMGKRKKTSSNVCEMCHEREWRRSRKMGKGKRVSCKREFIFIMISSESLLHRDVGKKQFMNN